jgi:hypothetical protein
MLVSAQICGRATELLAAIIIHRYLNVIKTVNIHDRQFRR